MGSAGRTHQSTRACCHLSTNKQWQQVTVHCFRLTAPCSLPVTAAAGLPMRRAPVRNCVTTTPKCSPLQKHHAPPAPSPPSGMYAHTAKRFAAEPSAEPESKQQVTTNKWPLSYTSIEQQTWQHLQRTSWNDQHDSTATVCAPQIPPTNGTAHRSHMCGNQNPTMRSPRQSGTYRYCTRSVHKARSGH